MGIVIGGRAGENYMNTRRKLLFALGAAAFVSPPISFAQQELRKVSRIGFLTRISDASVSSQIDAFRQGLRDLGWIEGKSIRIEYRDAEGQADRLPALAADLVGLNVDVIVTVDTPPTQTAKQATSTIPIVIAVSADPVGAGLVSSLSHPAGNTTGSLSLPLRTDQKNLELLNEFLPKIMRVAMIADQRIGA
jgi:putative ABC transport system substrate-binding protein